MLMEIGDISRMLADQVDSLVAALLPGAVREGQEWRVGSVAGERGRSMAIHRAGLRKGVWQDFSADQGGDALDLVAAVKFGGNKSDAIKWARSWLGLDKMDPARIKETRAKIQQKAADEDRQAKDEAMRRMKAAKALWLSASEKLIGSPVDLYLLGRGIGIADLPRLPGALRFAPSLPYPPSMHGGLKTSWPAMVAAITNGEGTQIAVHRTFLQELGGGLVRKAPVKDAKLTYASYRGGSIPIARGASGKPISQAPDGDKLILCEGIEDGLSLALRCPEYRIHAAVSVSNFQNLVLPPAISEIIIAADNDPEEIVDERTGEIKPHPARVALQCAIDAFIDQGREVRIVRSPVGKDFNEALLAEAAQGLTKETMQ